MVNDVLRYRIQSPQPLKGYLRAAVPRSTVEDSLDDYRQVGNPTLHGTMLRFARGAERLPTAAHHPPIDR
jgi:hypothetical protein